MMHRHEPRGASKRSYRILVSHQTPWCLHLLSRPPRPSFRPLPYRLSRSAATRLRRIQRWHGRGAQAKVEAVAQMSTERLSLTLIGDGSIKWGTMPTASMATRGIQRCVFGTLVSRPWMYANDDSLCSHAARTRLAARTALSRAPTTQRLTASPQAATL